MTRKANSTNIFLCTQILQYISTSRGHRWNSIPFCSHGHFSREMTTILKRSLLYMLFHRRWCRLSGIRFWWDWDPFIKMATEFVHWNLFAVQALTNLLCFGSLSCLRTVEFDEFPDVIYYCVCTIPSLFQFLTKCSRWS